MNNSVFNERHINLSRRSAAEGMILLKNENRALPLSKEKAVALFGRNQTDVFKSGGGAADLWMIPVVSFADGIEAKGTVYKPLLERYRAFYEANLNKTMNCMWRFDMLGDQTRALYEVPIPESMIKKAATECDTAIFFIGRYSLEVYDIKDKQGEYRIMDCEKQILKQVCDAFDKVILVFNIPSLFDLSFLDECKVDAIIQLFMPGMEAGNALADVLYADVTPCGKLADTWAKQIEEYPTNESFATKTIPYKEGIYMGYRYFDTFKKDVEFPFGYGLSYTTFKYSDINVNVDKNIVSVGIRVTNTGSYNGKEIVQAYLSIPDGKLEQPYQVLCGFEKTGELKPDESEVLNIKIDITDFSSYCTASAEYILEEGIYILRVGSHSRNTKEVCALKIDKTVVTRKVENRVACQADLKLLKKNDRSEYSSVGLNVIEIDLSDIKTEVSPKFVQPTELFKENEYMFSDVENGCCTPEELVAQLTNEELANMMTGDCGWKRKCAGILPDEDIRRGEGSHSHPVPSLGIPASVMQDGPAGMRLDAQGFIVYPHDEINGTDCVCYPCASLLASTWDRKMVRSVAMAIAEDMDRYGFEGWCAPGVNLHRNPLCGRNFEYFSEDPFLTAELAISEIKGIQENEDGTPSGRYAIIKHFACNESEQERKESDSILNERTARELYLRPFDYAIHKCQPLAIMTSYNKINGVYAAAHKGLIDGICRTEWEYTGWIMTDWDVYASVGACIQAGNDIVMPGKYMAFDEICEQGTDKATMQKRAVDTIKHLCRTRYHKV